MYLKYLLTLSVSLLFLTACAHYDVHAPPPEKNKSYTQLPKGKAPLLEYLKHTDRKLGKKSAFYPLDAATDAFVARIFLIDHATTSLDVQYYIYENDRTGSYFSYKLLKAAERGVHVRLLVDDMITSGKDRQWAMLASHPNIELRLFNPNRLRTSFRNLALLFNVDRLGKRMHNKALIADGSAAIIGGRNIGDVYYAADKEVVFSDYDILAVGKVVPEIYEQFDLYWNSDEAVPSKQVLREGNINSSDYKKVIAKLIEESQAFRQSKIGQIMREAPLAKKLKKKEVQLIVSDKADLFYDHPEKVSTPESDTRTHISSQISDDLKEVNHELIIVSPYFIPSQEMMSRLEDLRKKGVKIIVVTNSLASTDVFPVYSGYRWYIKPLLEMGVQLYEVKPTSFTRFYRAKKLSSKLGTALHTKLMIIDDHRLVLGSANIDPRSDKLNTELLLIVSSKTLTQLHKNIVISEVNEEDLYSLTWGPHPLEPEDEGVVSYGPIWYSMENGKIKTYYSPPHAGFWKTLGTDIISFLPIEGYL